MLTDSFGRIHNYLRISLTSHCNLRCFYCMPDEQEVVAPSGQLMQAHEIIELARLFVRLGVTKIRLTGGEPLVRKDADVIISALGGLPVTLSLTTNGVRIQEFLPVIQEARIQTINVSLDTLDRDKFGLITRRNQFAAVWDNIHRLVDMGIQVKVNVVVMKGLNEGEIHSFIEWTKDMPVHVRFIEFMPFTGNRWTSNKVITWQEILGQVAAKYFFLPLEGAPNDTDKKYLVPGHAGRFSVISTMSAPFCSTCNRIRLTADGKLKNCLFSKDETDLLTALRNGEDLEPLIRHSLLQKAEERGGQLAKSLEQLEAESIQNRSMIAIGG